MDIVLIKIFATALAFSQVATTPDAVKTQFDPMADQPQVISLLRAGCAQVRKAFDIEALNIDDLIATAMDDADALAGGHAVFRGINIAQLHTRRSRIRRSMSRPWSSSTTGRWPICPTTAA